MFFFFFLLVETLTFFGLKKKNRVEKNLYEERIKTADGILLCVGLDDVASFTDAVGVHSEIMKVRSKYLPFIAVGTKCDSTTRKVPLDTFRGHFHRVGVPTFEVSLILLKL